MGDASTLADGLFLVALSPHWEMGRGPGRWQSPGHAAGEARAGGGCQGPVITMADPGEHDAPISLITMLRSW